MRWLSDRPIAHRGLHANDRGVPENSLSAFRQAAEKGYSIELDIRLTKDKQIIVFHDPDLSRMCGRVGKVNTFSLAEIKECRLLDSPEQIPTLQEVLDHLNGRVPVLIEVKNEGGRTGELEAELLKCMRGYSGVFAIQSFNPFSLIWFKRHSPDVLRGQLSGDFSGIPMPYLLKKTLQYMLLNFMSEPHFIAYDKSVLHRWYVQKVRRKGKALLGWTITSVDEWNAVERLCDNVIFEGFVPPK